MWEGEYIEFAATAKAGYLSRAEAETNWARWRDDESVARDLFGPRGYLRLYVATKTKLSKFDEVSKDKSFKKEEKLGKKASQQTIGDRLNMVLSNDADEGIDDLDAQSTLQKALDAFARSGSSSGAFSSGLAGVDVGELMQTIRAKVNKRKHPDGAGAKTEAESEDSTDSDAAPGKEDDKNVRTPDKGWFDETKVRKAQRSYLSTASGVESLLAETQQSMTQILAEVRLVPADAKDGIGVKLTSFPSSCPEFPTGVISSAAEGGGMLAGTVAVVVS